MVGFGTPTLVRVFLCTDEFWNIHRDLIPCGTCRVMFSPLQEPAGGREREARTVIRRACRVVGPYVGYFVGPHEF